MDSVSFDIIAFLEEHSIEYHTSGKNVGQGWIGLQCRFCTDQSNHLGVNLDSKVYSCMKCGEKGGPVKLVKTLLDCEWVEAYQEVERFSDLPPSKKERGIPRSESDRWKPKTLPIPSYFSKNFSKRHLAYLAGRKFNPSALIERYDLYAVGGIATPQWKWRVVAPVKIGGQVVNFIGRDITGKSPLRYRLEDNEKAIIPRARLLYNLDSVKDGSCLIVEGMTDVWRVGAGAIACVGTKVSDFQIGTLLDFGIKRASILFDPEPEAQRLARRLAGRLAGVMDKVVVLEKQTSGDPGDMSPDEVIELRRRVFLH